MSATLHLIHWKCHENLRLELGAGFTIVDLVVGVNGSGKSALPDAVEFALLGTGKLAGISQKADLGALAITDGADECWVSLQIGKGAEQFAVRRTMDTAGKQAIQLQIGEGGLLIEGKLRAQQERLEEQLGVSEAAIRAVLDARMLLSGPANDRRAVLFGASGIEVTEELVLEQFKIAGLEGDDVRVAAQDVPMQGWRNAEQLAIERRQQRGRDVKAMVCPEPQHLFRHSGTTAEDEPVDLRQWPIADLERKRASNTDAVATAQRGVGISVGAAQETLRQKQTQLERVEKERGLVSERAVEGRPAVGQLYLTLQDADRELVEAEAGVEACTAHRDQVGPAISTAGELVKPKICPAIPGGFECPATKARLDKHRHVLHENAEARAADIEQAQEQLELAVARLSAAKETRETAWNTYDTEAKLKLNLGRLAEAIDEAEVDVNVAVDGVTKAENSEATAEQVAFHQKRLSATIETIEARKRYDEAVAAVESFAINLASAQDAHARADRIAQLLKPSGIETALLVGLTEPLQNRLDEVAGFFGPLRITAALDIEMRVGDQWRRYSQLSESQRERVAIAVQHAVASLAGFPLLIVDRVDHLDADGKAACMQALCSVAQNYQAVLALATMQGHEPTAAMAVGVSTWYLAGGEIARVE